MLLFKGMISVLLTISSIALSATPALSTINTVSDHYFDCNSIAQFERVDFENAEIVTLKGDSLTTKTEEKILELAQNGTDVFVECDSSSAIVEDYCSVFRESSDSEIDNFLGVYFHKDITGTKASPVTFSCMYPEGEEVSREQRLLDYKNIKENPNVTAEELQAFFDNIVENSVNRSTLTKSVELPEPDTLDKMFYHEYAYDIAYYNSTDKELWWFVDNKTSYKKIGYTKLSVCLYNAGNALNRNYDSFVITTVAGAIDSYSVVSYKTEYSIDPYITLLPQYPQDTTGKTISVSYGVEINSDGTFSRVYTTTETINPGGQTFSPVTKSDDIDVNILTSTPASLIKGQEWTTQIGGNFSTPQNEKCLLTVGVPYLKIKWWKTYTWDESLKNSLYLFALFKDHEETTI